MCKNGNSSQPASNDSAGTEAPPPSQPSSDSGSAGSSGDDYTFTNTEVIKSDNQERD